MLNMLLNMMPDWMLGLIGAFAVWFGINYLWLAPRSYEFQVQNETHADFKPYHYANASFIRSSSCLHQLREANTPQYRWDMALETSTFGLAQERKWVWSKLVPIAEYNRCTPPR